MGTTVANRRDPLPRPVAARESRRLRWIAPLLGLSAFFYLVPPFVVVPLEAARQESETARFDVADHVEEFWKGPLLESTKRATDAAELLAALQRDSVAASKRFGHRLGLGSSTFYFVSGRGRIVAADRASVQIALRDGGPAEVIIELGPVFGNAIRDGSGLLDVSDFPNGQDFNALSAEINRRVEERVLPLLKGNSAVGTAVRFVGGVEVADSAGAPSSLNLVPVQIEFP